MDITPRIAGSSRIIQSYTNGQFRVSNQLYAGAIIVMPQAVYTWEDADLSENAIKAALATMPPVEVVLLGAGTVLSGIPSWVRTARPNLGLSVDVMDTGAACRTYNVLLTEGRQVAAFLLPAT